ncbi:MAG: bifunctional molybdenum cofactor biosynthesis protein MoaC/MoaB [Nevskiaceae bacterium]|nr:MAG: bifunctional molybdenum cofactor biosynthesis protein MoaC/MoaB [Nevskiaceae bacterium]TBR72799.1 MAG: bifunctional molybdenum cofactor biosynthesis protein MoaC/MoaB [Nevskiaceae bacterium]
MADVRNKRITARRAVAVGEFAPGQAWDDVVQHRLPKGDALTMAELAGLQGAKRATELIPLCHPLPLEFVEVHCVPVAERRVIRVYCEAATHARTGVEMEALAGVNAALLTLYDLTKPVFPALSFGNVRLLFKEGGKKGLWVHPEGMTDAEHAHYQPRAVPGLQGISAAVITLSDRASQGVYADKSGPILVERLQALGADVPGSAEILPDDPARLVTRLRELIAADTRLVLCTGGTGIGPRDRTPEALAEIADRGLSGIGEMFRAESSQHTVLAWISRATAVQARNTLVIALPGSSRAVAQGMDILAPILAHTLQMVAGASH